MELNYDKEGNLCGNDLDLAEEFKSDHFHIIFIDPKKKPIIYLSGRKLKEKCLENELVYKLNQTLWPNHCVMGSEGADYVTELNTKQDDLVVKKGFHCEVSVSKKAMC